MNHDYNTLIFKTHGERDDQGPRLRSVYLEPGHLLDIGRSSMSNARNWKAGIHNLLFDCKVMSRYHAKLEAPNGLPGSVSLTDMSKYGTFLNDRKLSKGIMTPIRPGDKLQFGMAISENEPLTVFVDFHEREPAAQLLGDTHAYNTYSVPSESIWSELDEEEDHNDGVVSHSYKMDGFDSQDDFDEDEREHNREMDQSEMSQSEIDQGEMDQIEDFSDHDVVLDTVQPDSIRFGSSEWPTSSNPSLPSESPIRVVKVDEVLEPNEKEEVLAVVLSETEAPSEAMTAIPATKQENSWDKELRLANAQRHADLDRLLQQSRTEIEQGAMHPFHPVVLSQPTSVPSKNETDQATSSAAEKRISIDDLINSEPAENPDPILSLSNPKTAFDSPVADLPEPKTADSNDISRQPASKQKKSNRLITSRYKVTKPKAVADNSPRTKTLRKALSTALTATAYASIGSVATIAFLASPLAERLAAL